MLPRNNNTTWRKILQRWWTRNSTGTARRRNTRRAESGMATPALIEKLEDRLLLTTITVNSTDDTVIADADTTLREAIIAANATAGHDTIEFNIAGGGSAQTIDLASILPTVTDSVTIDGSTQGGWLTIDAAAVGTDTVLKLTTQAGGSTLQHFGISNAEVLPSDSTVLTMRRSRIWTCLTLAARPKG